MLIDYENVQPEDIEALNKEYYKVKVFIGSSQSSLKTKLATAIHNMTDRAEYITINGNGKNALDFHIAFYIGQLSMEEPYSFFHIISKDTGFDPLIRHLKDKKILACRSADISEMPLEKVLKAKTKSEKVAIIIDNLKGREASKPSTFSKLLTDINSVFKKQLPEEEIKTLLDYLIKQKLIIVSDDMKVTYNISDSKKETTIKPNPLAVKPTVAAKQATIKVVIPKTTPVKKSVEKVVAVETIIEKPKIPSSKKARLNMAVSLLKEKGIAIPKTSKALLNIMKSIFRNQLSEKDIQAIFDEMQKQKIIAVSGKKVIYNLLNSIIKTPKLTVAETNMDKAVNPKSLSENLTKIINALKKREMATPKTTEALYNEINHILGKKLSSLGLLDIFNELKKQGIVIVSADDKMKVTYNIGAT